MRAYGQLLALFPIAFYQWGWDQDDKARGGGGVGGSYPEQIWHGNVEGGEIIRGRNYQVVEAPWPLALPLKATQQIDQEPEDARIRRSTQ